MAVVLRVAGVVLIVATGLTGCGISAHAAVTFSGEVLPADVSSWNGTTLGKVGITAASTGTIRVDGGSVLASGGGLLGSAAGATGIATVSGVGSKWNMGGYGANIGDSGNGSLSIDSGGQVTNGTAYIGHTSSGSGHVVVGGANSIYTTGEVYVAQDGSGELRIESGGVVNSYSAAVAYSANSIGNVTVTGTGSKWISSQYLSVGIFGNGSMTISDGAQVSDYAGGIGGQVGAVGAVTVTGSGSKWTNTDALEIAPFGIGSLTVSGGGVVSANELYASRSNLFGNGTINVKGAVLDADIVFSAAKGTKSTVTFGTTGKLNITTNSSVSIGAGYNGTGTIRITEGVSLSTYYGYLGYHAGSNGSATITGNGSKWNTIVYAGYDGNGSLTIEAGGQLESSLTYIGNNATATGTATITGASSLWTSTNTLGVGWYGKGSLAVLAGATINGTGATLAYGSAATGTALVSGTGSTWNNSGTLIIGDAGAGSLSVAAGAQLTSATSYIGRQAYVPCSAAITGAGSTWICSDELTVGSFSACTLKVDDGARLVAKALHVPASGLSGNGTIDVKGLTFDCALTFDATHGLQQTIPFGSGGRLNVDLNGTAPLGIGFSGPASLRITDGLTVNSTKATVSAYSGSVATATVRGVNSKWISAGPLTVGGGGTGTLIIEAGAQVTDTDATLASLNGSKGTVIVRGSGSQWTNSGTLTLGSAGPAELVISEGALVTNTSATMGYRMPNSSTVTLQGLGSKWTNTEVLTIGGSGNATVNIESGGQLAARAVQVYSHGTLSFHVSGNNMAILGTTASAGVLQNLTTVNFYADAFLPPNAYVPMIDVLGRTLTLVGSGAYNSIGGTWNGTTKTFTVAAANEVDAGTTIVPGAGSRMIFHDASGARVGVSVAGASGSSSLSAMPMPESQLGSLPLGDGETVLFAWNITSNLSANSLLSFEVAPAAGETEIWRYSNATWTQYYTHLVYRDGIASFATDGSPGYAVVSVPEPAAYVLLLVGLITAAWLQRRNIRT